MVIMNLCVLIPSRGRPASLTAALTLLDATASGRHIVDYRVSWCSDDTRTYRAVESLPRHVRSKTLAVCRTDDCTPGQAFNEMVNGAEATGRYQGYVSLCDDVFCISPDWDDQVAMFLTSRPAGAWLELADPESRSYAFFSHRVVKALGSVASGFFPFWFLDTWFNEVHRFAFHRPLDVVRSLRLAGKRHKTQGMRELGFWADLFAMTRPDRIVQGHRLAEEYGHAKLDPSREIDMMILWDHEFRAKCCRFEKDYALGGEPEAYYVLAKQRAMDMLAAGVS